MKKTRILMLTMIVFSTITAGAQIRHNKGVKGIDLMGWYSPNSSSIGAGFVSYLGARSYYKIQFGVDLINLKIDLGNGEISENKNTSYFLDGIYNHTLFNFKESIFINGQAIIGVYYEDIKSDRLVLSDGRFLVGGGIGTEVELFILDNLILIINANQRAYPGSDLKNGEFRFYAGGGFRVSF